MEMLVGSINHLHGFADKPEVVGRELDVAHNGVRLKVV
jgi:hypothetical protein